MIEQSALIIAVISLICSCVLTGILMAIRSEIFQARIDLRVKIDDFDQITRKASEANNSMAQKLINIEDRIEFMSSQYGMNRK